MENVHYNFPGQKGDAFKCLVCPTNSPTPKRILFTMILNQEKQQIITFENLKTWLKQWINYQNRAGMIIKSASAVASFNTDRQIP